MLVFFGGILTLAAGCAGADPIEPYNIGGLLTVASVDPYWTVSPNAFTHYYTAPGDITSGFVTRTNTPSFVASRGSNGSAGLHASLAAIHIPEPPTIALAGLALLTAGRVFRQRFVSASAPGAR